MFFQRCGASRMGNWPMNETMLRRLNEKRRQIAVWLLLPILVGGCGGAEDAANDSPAPSVASPVRPPEDNNNRPDGAQQKTPKQPPQSQRVYRPDDQRPQHDDTRLAEVGIQRYESQRLILYTDIDPEVAKPLPGLMDEAYRAWEEYFGPLPPNRAGSDFQMTGYLMGDKRLFVETGLLPEDLPDFPHGRNRGIEFWMNDQEHDYYRRHLMIHEGTHCFMTAMPGVLAPSSYMEGMAELFGTHRTDAQGRTTFRIMPTESLEVRGWGRLQIIAAECAAGRPQSVMDIFNYGHNSFLKTESYAWSWALCKFLDAHPRYRDRFRELGGYLQGTQFSRKFQEFYRTDLSELNREWALFTSGLNYDYDVERAAIKFPATQALAAGRETSVEIQANRGWQSSGVEVEAGAAYEITAEGMVTLAQTPRPWEATAEGITIRYHDGQPLGRLLAVVVPKNATAALADGIEPVGAAATLRPRVSGTLFLRVNDAWGELSDNGGTYRVRVTRRAGDS
ncbi:hypothetical protein Mal52_43700 [Symmachiella dynata]|uniref:DUF1570 domain-containing protein n=2 Tax=Symmachiella dynata TaxID=2527995 RepID=A0A517ZTT1_9PLAN|nr:hypothetical protein Mal52_43700 [Symmachiella dynata]